MNIDNSPNQRAAFASVTSLFFAWGFITSVIDPLVPAIRAIFSLSFTEALLTQFAFFTAYGVASVPAARLLARIGAGRAVVVAIMAMAAGCLIMPLATFADDYPIVLVSLFVLASGITLLQVSANPLALALGEPRLSHFRLNLAQALNSLGTVLGPFAGSLLLLRGGLFTQGAAPHEAARRAESFANIDQAYVLMAVLLVALALFIWRQHRRFDQALPQEAESSMRAAFASPFALFGALAIFLYVGAEVSIGSVMINYLHQGDVLGVPLDRAGKLLSLYWSGALVGRFAGSMVLRRVSATRVLGAAAAAAFLLCAVTSQSTGMTAAVAAIAVGLMNSVMFPTIFSLTLAGASAPVSSTSGLLCVAIVGGAVLPLVTGRLADVAGLHMAFLVPAAAYLGVLAFAMAGDAMGVARSGQARATLAKQ